MAEGISVFLNFMLPLQYGHGAPSGSSRAKAGIVVYDVGENFASWTKIVLHGGVGRKLKLLPGKLLDAEGLVTQRSANARPRNEVSFSYMLFDHRAESSIRIAPQVLVGVESTSVRYTSVLGEVAAPGARGGWARDPCRRFKTL